MACSAVVVVAMFVNLGTVVINKCGHDELDVCAGLVEKVPDGCARKDCVTSQPADTQGGADVL